MKKKVLIIKGYSKTDIELINDKKIVQLYIDYFTSNAGGVFNLNTEIIYLEDPNLDKIQQLEFLNNEDYLIVILIGHGANKDGIQVFQLQEDLFIHPGQIQFKSKKQLFIIETCRDIIDFELDIKRVNKLIPKYKYGGVFKAPLTREQALEKFNGAIIESPEGTVYLFAASIGESAIGYLFLKLIVHISIYIHEYYRNSTIDTDIIFENAKNQVISYTNGEQNPVKIGDVKFPFVITII